MKRGYTLHLNNVSLVACTGVKIAVLVARLVCLDCSTAACSTAALLLHAALSLSLSVTPNLIIERVNAALWVVNIKCLNI